MANYPRNTLILTTEPFIGFMPADLYAWVNEHSSDRDLAVALGKQRCDLIHGIGTE